MDVAAQDNQKTTLDLQACLDYALRNSYEVRKAFLDTEESNAQLKESKGALLPQLSGSANLTDNIKLPVAVVQDFPEEGQAFKMSLGTKNNKHN
jgi:outer membrane protein TolC